MDLLVSIRGIELSNFSFFSLGLKIEWTVTKEKVYTIEPSSET